MGPSDRVLDPSSSANDTCHVPSAHTGPSDLVRHPSSSANDTCPVPSMRTGPSYPVRGPSGSTKDSCHLATTCTGPSDPVWGPSGSPNDICQLASAHGPQRPRAGSQRLAKRYIPHSQCAQGPQCTPCVVPTARQIITATFPARRHRPQ
ncbi:UNVERIFIED_CONTAM: hypothetical protein FKN15_043768 [Acipenser sinensis]